MAPRSRRAWFSVLLGLVLGFTLASRLIAPRATELKKGGQRRASGSRGCAPTGALAWRRRDAAPQPPLPSRSFLFVGVMTAQKYVRSRAVAAYRTWAQTIPGKVVFFSSEGSATAAPIPLVALKNVDDSYPPQKKSFMMLKHMHDHYLEQFEWFMRADDDVYIKGHRLEGFLRSLNSSEAIYLGQTGMGARDELGKLALEPGENFCMGGPGVIMSREVLRRVAPHIGQCLREMYTTHEDVEVGRCVRRFAGVQCVWSYEMQQLFYENYEPNKKGYLSDLHNSKIHGAITLHPNKSPPHQYRLHSYLLSRKIAELRYRTVRLHREIVQASRYGAGGGGELRKEDLQLGAAPSFMRFQPHRRQDVLEWDFLTGRHICSAAEGQPPRRGMEAPQKAALEDIIMQMMEMINSNAKTRGRIVDFKEIQYGYRRVNPLYGAEYVLDLLLLYKKQKGKAMTVPVRRHAYLQQTFSRIQFREEEELDAQDLASRINRDSGSLTFLSNSLKMLVPFSLGGTAFDRKELKEERVNVLVPLSGRYEIFARFMANFEKVCLIPSQNVKLLVLLFSADDMEQVRPVELMRDYHVRYPKADLEILPVSAPFSRAVALQVGSSHFSNDSLLFYCDVDLLFTVDFLSRCRSNTMLGQQAYFPIIFSQFDPKVVYAGMVPSSSHYVFTSKTGLWRHFGFGIACVYKGDLVRAGGFDVSIQGWGLEDVDLFNKFVQSGIRLFRSTDTGIVHVYHSVLCDPNLEPRQFKMCLGSKASSYGSVQQLAELWLEKNEAAFGRTSSSSANRSRTA